MNKRLLKEVSNLTIQQSQRNLLDNDYIVHFNEENMSKIYALIKAPSDSVYKHKFIRLDFDIPSDYPHTPPKVTFVNYDGVRIHPNMYQDGKCCSTILNTWGNDKYEKWTSSMGIETILLAFHSFFDNDPYTYEPGGVDDPSYSVYVQYQSWTTCLIRYIQNETIPLFRQMIENYMLLNVATIFEDLQNLKELYPYNLYNTRCFEVDDYVINYGKVIDTLQEYYMFIDYKEDDVVCDTPDSQNYDCDICFDTSVDNGVLETLKECGHTFHQTCISNHIKNNLALCPMCRAEIKEAVIEIEVDYIINPTTQRRIKVGGKTYNTLVNQGII